MISLLGLLMLICGSAALGGLLGGLISASLTRAESSAPLDFSSAVDGPDAATAEDIELAAELWSVENGFPEAREIIAEKLSLLARLRDRST